MGKTLDELPPIAAPEHLQAAAASVTDADVVAAVAQNPAAPPDPRDTFADDLHRRVMDLEAKFAILSVDHERLQILWDHFGKKLSL